MPRKRTAVLLTSLAGATLLVVVAVVGRSTTDGGSPDRLPERVAWAWERPEDLRFLDPERAAVAVLVQTVLVDGGGIAVVGRRQPLVLPKGIGEVAVTRIEVAAGTALDAGIRRQVATAIAAGSGRAKQVQVDFDARESERGFYADLLTDLGRRLPETPITITALASWCLGDRWLDRAWPGEPPIDDAVPMLFRMGVDAERVRAHLAAGGDFASPLCRRSLGLSTDEPRLELPASWLGSRRLYLFHPRPWSAAAWTAAAAGAPPTETR